MACRDKNIEDNNSALFFLNKIQESGEIVSENKTVSTDKKEIMEILLKWLKKNSVDIIIIINGIETNKVNLTNDIFDEIKKNKSLNIRSF